jgi:hypothetical protein
VDDVLLDHALTSVNQRAYISTLSRC